jgi:hypothetical protein
MVGAMRREPFWPIFFHLKVKNSPIATVIYITIKHVQYNEFDALHSYFGQDCILFALPCLICASASYAVFNVDYTWSKCAEFLKIVMSRT